MSQTFAHLITPTGLTAFVNGTQYAVPVDHMNYARIVAAIQSNDISGAVALMDIRASVRKFISTDDRFELVNDLIAFNGDAFCQPVTDKVLELIEAGNQPAPLFQFLEKVRQNPSNTAQTELLLFCVANNFMIDTHGDIIAYKSVRDNFSDVHSGTVWNIVGTRVQMPRHKVDDNRDNTCSHGLHFASYEYASTWAGQSGNRLMVLAVNPKHVVSIPVDYNNQKGRCEEYTVLAEMAGFGRLAKKAVYDDMDFRDAEEDEGDEHESDADNADAIATWEIALKLEQDTAEYLNARLARMKLNQPQFFLEGDRLKARYEKSLENILDIQAKLYALR